MLTTLASSDLCSMPRSGANAPCHCRAFSHAVIAALLLMTSCGSKRLGKSLSILRAVCHQTHFSHKLTIAVQLTEFGKSSFPGIYCSSLKLKLKLKMRLRLGESEALLALALTLALPHALSVALQLTSECSNALLGSCFRSSRASSHCEIFS